MSEHDETTETTETAEQAEARRDAHMRAVHGPNWRQTLHARSQEAMTSEMRKLRLDTWDLVALNAIRDKDPDELTSEERWLLRQHESVRRRIEGEE